jgi:molybdopterin/thiamine biosynthesis adenylyltransferase/rhodanese-related sulfurtransferase
MEPDEWSRYNCQMALPEFGKESQTKLQHAKALIVGAGGLGCPAALYLAASGVGTIGIADFDIISTGNLHRQILYAQHEVGLSKAETACKKLHDQNPQIKIIPIVERITSGNVMRIIHDYDIVVDCTDNFETKYLLNDACVLTGRPLVYGAIYQYEGQVSLLNVLNKDGKHSPNYRDLFSAVNASQIPNCAEGGVIPTIAGITGCMQANEVIKWITGSGDLLSGKMLMIDARTLQTRIIKTGAVTKTNITGLEESIPVSMITIADLKNKINEFELVDVRNKEERMQYHIGGTHIPLAEMETSWPLLRLQKPVVFYCESGTRSMEALKIVKRQFPEHDLFSLEGGLQAWKELGLS